MRSLSFGMLFAALLPLPVCLDAREADAVPAADGIGVIQSYCLDFNWGQGRRFAEPGRRSGADPAGHVAWYKAMGANVIQTFAVSCNGFTRPRTDCGIVPLEPTLTRPVDALRGDDRNIAALARAFHNLPIEAVWTAESGFGDPER